MKRAFDRITAYANVPRKEKKFINFAKNSLNIHDIDFLQRLWKHFGRTATSGDAKPASTLKKQGPAHAAVEDSEPEPVPAKLVLPTLVKAKGDLPSIVSEIKRATEVQATRTVKKKKSKKEKKQKSERGKKDGKKRARDEQEEDAVTPDARAVRKKKSKKEKKEGKKAKKAKKEKAR